MNTSLAQLVLGIFLGASTGSMVATAAVHKGNALGAGIATAGCAIAFAIVTAWA